MNLNKTREFETSITGAEVKLNGDGTTTSCLTIREQWVTPMDLREIAKKLNKWADKLEAASA